MPQYANKNWYNAHNFYGDLADIEAATLKDAKDFSQTYYAPNNAALALVGDFDEDQAKKWIEKYFGAIPASKLPPKPDLGEPRQEAEQRFTQDRQAGDEAGAGHRLSHAAAPARRSITPWCCSTRFCCKATTAC